MKIAFTIDSMYNSGGMERILTTIANHLSQNYTVYIITAFQKDRPYFYRLDNKVHSFDLGVVVPNVSGFTFYAPVKKAYWMRLKEFLFSEHFDVVTSLGGLDLDFLPKIHDGSKKIVWFHFAIDIAKTTWIKGKDIKSRFIANLITLRRIYYARKYDKIVVLSKTDLRRWLRYTNKVVTIYNPVTIFVDGSSEYKSKRVIAVGRLDYQKGFDYLIKAWKQIYKEYPDWKLDIYGDGPLRKELEVQIKDNGLSHVLHLQGVSSNIVKEYQNHSFIVSSSRAEGFPLVLIEASACGLPIVSFDCPSGPSEIVEHGGNGFLVSPVGNIDAMANRVMQLMADKSLRQKMGRRSLELSQRFKLENIAAEWIELYNQLVSS